MKTRCLFLIKSRVGLTEPSETPFSWGVRWAGRWGLPGGLGGTGGPVRDPMAPHAPLCLPGALLILRRLVWVM